MNNKTITIPRDKIVSAYAGSIAAKECLIHERHQLGIQLGIKTTFKEQYKKALEKSIKAANEVGLSTTLDLLSHHFYPGKDTNSFLKELLDHPDNPFYPFFEND